MRLIAKLGWIAGVVAAFVAGGVWRLLRRIARRPPRIWHGMVPVHMTRDMARADRIAGFPSRNVAITAKLGSYALVTAGDFDVVLDAGGAAADSLHWRAMIDLFLHGDIWSTYFDCHFFPISEKRRNRLALALVRAAGIRIIVTTHGSDVIQLLPEKSRYDWIGRMQLDYAQWDFAAQTLASRERVALFTRDASLVIAPYPPLVPFLGRYDLLFLYFPIEIPAEPAIPRPHGGPVVIVHAPNHRHVKGTEYLLASVEDLKRRGLDVELVLVEGVPRTEALQIYRRADIIADQFIIGAFGVFALEGLALGKPTVTYVDDETLAHPQFRLPLINATPETLTDVLATLVADPERRTSVGKASREAVMRYHSMEAMAEVWGRVYRHVWWGKPLDLETTTHFSRSAAATGRRSAIAIPDTRS